MDAIQCFKRRVEYAASEGGTAYPTFAREIGLCDFLLDDHPDDAREIAASALDELLQRNGSQFDYIICAAVVAYLDEAYGVPSCDKTAKVRYRDLSQSAKLSTTTRSAFLKWTTSWWS